ncbi:NADH-quinone oxidoreductase subunit H [bacterium]|nr:NADH-quinone oxidoreductase subunit H [bacterium]
MESVRGALIAALQGIVLVALAPLLNGLIRKVKARLQRRIGPPLLQHYRDVAKLFRKESIRPSPASWIFDAAPIVSFATASVAAALTPAICALPATGQGDVVTVIYLLALGRFFVILAGLDAASSFGGLGSSRDAAVSVFAEPVAMLSLAVVAAALRTTTDVSGISLASTDAAVASGTSLGLLAPWRLLAALAFFIVVLAECARVPFDNPATHLELTMVHEAMLLEYSGPSLALVTLASLAKQLVLLSIVASGFFPVGVATSLQPAALLVAGAVFVAKLAGLAVLIAIVESAIAKVRFLRVPDYLGVAFGIALLAYVAREAF